ncbi:hypothetical protein [Paenibacillus sp. O199]|uniref:hypothetical protein n=1 Tax=Paenibacillus sp. O199 TaxID=1643925 RepID=UPI0007BEFE46|nr:hypothetical protein [Paenibacillus sp. O199]
MGIWLVLFILYALSIKNVRKQLPNLLSTIFNKKILIWLISMTLYFIVIILVLKHFELWETRQVKDTIIWFLFVGIVFSSRAVGKAKDILFFSTVVVDNIKIIALIEFITNLYSFKLWWELIQVFIITILAALSVLIDHPSYSKAKDSKPLKNFINTILSILGFMILIHSIISFINNWDELIVKNLLLDLFLPLSLSVSFIIYVYLFVLYAAYEILFIRIGFKQTIEDRYRLKLKIRILVYCNLSLYRVTHFIQRSLIMNSYIRNPSELKRIFANYRSFNERKQIQEDSNIS